MTPLIEIHETVNGPMMLLKTDTVICESLRTSGDYAPEEKALLKQVISEGMTIIDVGANIGNHTLFFAKQTGPNGQVHSFEPQRFLFNIMSGNVALNSLRNVWCYRAGVGTEERDIEVPVPNYDRPNNYGGYSLDFATFKEIGKLMTLDSIALERCDLMKVDVEGMELDVLKGSRATIEKHKPLLYLEYNRPDTNPELLTYLCDELSYRVFRHGPNVLAHHKDVAAPDITQSLSDITPKNAAPKASAPASASSVISVSMSELSAPSAAASPQPKAAPSDASIFVSIACFSDPDVVDTARDAIAKATNPDHVSIGICLQVDPSDTQYEALHDIPNVRLDRIDISEARGPIFARSRCEALMTDETHFLQIDCHTRFFPGWDQIMLNELKKCEQINPKAVLSHYPININNMQSADHLDRIGHVNRYRHIGADAIKSHGSLIKLPADPTTSVGISAAMLFMPAHVRRSFPYDPHLHFGLHAAEQVLYAVRLWTHGYDIYCPTEHALATDYEGSRDRIPNSAKLISNSARGQWPKATWSKVKYLLALDTEEQVDAVYKGGLSEAAEKYGVGTERSLLSYYKFAGIHDELKEAFPHYRYASD